MSTVYQRADTWFIAIPTESGKWVKKTTGTRDKSVAKGMARMVDELGPRGRRSWDLLNPVARGDLTIGQLYDAYSQNDLDGLRVRLNDVDLEPHVARWIGTLRGRLASDTVEHYEVYARSLIGENNRFARSALTNETVVQWLAARPVGRSTKRKYHAALSSFCEYLKSIGLLSRNPMRDIRAPRPAPSRMRSLDQQDVERLITAQRAPYSVLSALLHATGMEVSVALSLKRRDVDVYRREIRARGTKTKCRDRIVKVAEWGWPLVERHISLLTPNALLFPGINRWTASDKHRAACSDLEIEDYQLKDSRHTYAVRAIRAGAPFEVVAQQLGHVDTTMVVRVYGRFKPTAEEVTAWERRAALLDMDAATAKQSAS